MAGKAFEYALERMDAWTMEVCDELERRLDEPSLIERIADAHTLSPDRFAQRFADATGIFPEEYLRRIRLARARVLLERTTLTVPQVMAAVGIEDGTAFERAFECQHGLTPTAFRRRAWNTDDVDGASRGPTAKIPDRRRGPRR